MNRSILIGAILISAAILLNGFLERRAHIPPTDTALATRTVPAPNQTIAVLPFKSLDSTDPDNSLGEGIQREIITRLTAKHVKAAGVRETPPTGEVLLGTVQRAGDRVRVTVQLVDAASRLPRWAESYDRELTDVLALQSEIAESVTKAIAAKQKA
jgi:TolB-like protein